MINTTTTTSTQDAARSNACAVASFLGDAPKQVGPGYREVSRARMSGTTRHPRIPNPQISNLPIVVDAFPGVRGWSPPV